eukprot:TRINITY_DN25829_c0_g1_i1.p1 TRINITY_DN25829_c0_g1~~TRINITY_DN25829_c0_g1_i1.p1  ORF type:complete len:410 (+),score=90.11 TRINITY_DN25829_c0_g1_i1:75-1304(+)
MQRWVRLGLSLAAAPLLRCAPTFTPTCPVEILSIPGAAGAAPGGGGGFLSVTYELGVVTDAQPQQAGVMWEVEVDHAGDFWVGIGVADTATKAPGMDGYSLVSVDSTGPGSLTEYGPPAGNALPPLAAAPQNRTVVAEHTIRAAPALGPGGTIKMFRAGVQDGAKLTMGVVLGRGTASLGVQHVQGFSQPVDIVFCQALDNALGVPNSSTLSEFSSSSDVPSLSSTVNETDNDPTHILCFVPPLESYCAGATRLEAAGSCDVMPLYRDLLQDALVAVWNASFPDDALMFKFGVDDTCVTDDEACTQGCKITFRAPDKAAAIFEGCSVDPDGCEGLKKLGLVAGKREDPGIALTMIIICVALACVVLAGFFLFRRQRSGDHMELGDFMKELDGRWPDDHLSKQGSSYHHA